MKWRSIALTFVLSLGIIPLDNANAIYKGTSALGSPFVVKYTRSGSWCSGTLVQPQILVTAAHCVIDTSGQAINVNSIGVYSPGADTTNSSIVAKGFQIFFPIGYYNDTAKTRPNDIAFIVLDRAVNSRVILKLANFETTQSLISKGVVFTTFGYGAIALNMQTSIPQQLIARPTSQLNYAGYGGFERTYINYLADESGSVCPGDSGGPTIAESNGETYLISINSGAKSPCSSPEGGGWSSVATIAGEYSSLLESAETLLAKIKPTDVTNIRVSSTSLNGIINWDIPINSPAIPTGYLIRDAGLNEICRTTSNSCQVVLKPGLNTFTVVTVAGSVLSNGVSTEYFVKNATNPELLELLTYQTQAAVKWAAISDFGGATPDSTFIEIRDETNNELLCSALSSDRECRFTRTERTYNLSLNIRSNLGQTTTTRIGTYAGITQSSLVIRTEMISKDLSLQLKSALAENPGYALEIEKLKLTLPEISGDYIFREEILAQLIATRTNISTLKTRMISKPRKIAISCAKGKQKKSVTGVKPICPPGFKKV